MVNTMALRVMCLVYLRNETKADKERALKIKCGKMMSGNNEMPDHVRPWFGVWILLWLQWSDRSDLCIRTFTLRALWLNL